MKTLYFYGYTVPKNRKQKSKRVTVSGIINQLDSKVSEIRIGVAICSNKDQFIKSRGRAIATGRAMSDKNHHLLVTNNDTVKNTFISTAKKIISEEL